MMSHDSRDDSWHNELDDEVAGSRHIVDDLAIFYIK
jgi:hypothetical protein